MTQNNQSNGVLIPTAENNMAFPSATTTTSIPVNTGNQQGMELVQQPARDVSGKFVSGVCPNPNGRPKGSRNKLTETVMRTLMEDFSANGKEALERLRMANPEAYLRILVSLLPRNAIQKWENSLNIDSENITQEEFAELVEQLRREKIISGVLDSISR